MKTILCFGDSNTWGQDPETGQRYSSTVRWPGVLRERLGEGYVVIEEGLPGRTTVFRDPLEEYKCGKDYFAPCLQSHAPVDVVIILLGTNDIQTRYAASALDIALGAGALVAIAQQSATGADGMSPDVLLVAPPPIKTVPEPWEETFAGGEKKSRRFAEHYQRIAELEHCAFFDAGKWISSSDTDGIHWDASEHEKLGKVLAVEICRLVG